MQQQSINMFDTNMLDLSFGLNFKRSEHGAVPGYYELIAMISL